MPRKRFKTEEIIQKLREAEVLLSEGQSAAEHLPYWSQGVAHLQNSCVWSPSLT